MIIQQIEIIIGPCYQGSYNEVEVALPTSPGWRAREAGPSCTLPNISKPCSSRLASLIVTPLLSKRFGLATKLFGPSFGLNSVDSLHNFAQGYEYREYLNG